MTEHETQLRHALALIGDLPFGLLRWRDVIEFMNGLPPEQRRSGDDTDRAVDVVMGRST